MKKTSYRKATVADAMLFYGDSASPLLAPRGVHLAQNTLMVADTGQNRVFIWNELPSTAHQQASIVLGQQTPDATGRNAGGRVSASTLQYPSGLWSDGQRLIVADAWNHRVLIWNQFPSTHGQPADLVLGQPDFEQNQPNVAGLTAKPSERSCYWPYGVFSDGTRLWIADTGNRRVLYFSQIPEQSYSPADAVIGQESFEHSDYEPQNAIWPYSVKVSPSGALGIADTQYYRVLIWKDFQTAANKPADVIIGQDGFSANGQNQYQWTPEAFTLSWCYDLCFDRHGLWVADTGNSRLLWYENLPVQHNQPAQDLFGQPDFQTGSENSSTLFDTADTLYWPFSICIEKSVMAIADTGNHRIIFHHLNYS